jgi:protease I
VNRKILEGKKIAVIVENKFIPEEIEAYRSCFALHGAETVFVSRLWYGDYKPGSPSWKSPVVWSDVDPTDMQPWQTPSSLSIPDANDVSNLRLDDFAAVIMSANYVSVRLRYPDDPSITDPRALVQSAPVVRFFAEAMRRDDIVKGALCHGLWILSPNPDLLKGRKVTCHTVVMSDILNCGAEAVFEDGEEGRRQPAKVVRDGDLVTGFSKHEVVPFIEAIVEAIAERQGDPTSEAAKRVVGNLRSRFGEAKRNRSATRPVAKAARDLLDGTLDAKAEVARMIGVELPATSPRTTKPVLLVASIFGTWASELTLVASLLRKAGRQVRIATENGEPPHLLSPSLQPDFKDGAWKASVVSPAERDLALKYLDPASPEHALFAKEAVLDLRSLARPPQVGDYLDDPSLLDDYSSALERTMHLAHDYDAICIAGGSGAIPGLMFDRGLHALLLAFHKLGKPIMGECNGGLAILQTIDPDTGRSILHGRAVTTHSSLDEYQAEWGWTSPFAPPVESFWKGGFFDIQTYAKDETWNSPGTGGNPLVDSEGYFRAVAGSGGTFFSPPGSPYSVVVDGHFVTCRTTPDGYPGALALLALLEGAPPPTGKLFIDSDARGRSTP